MLCSSSGYFGGYKGHSGGGTTRTTCDAVHHALPSLENISVSKG